MNKLKLLRKPIVLRVLSFLLVFFLFISPLYGKGLMVSPSSSTCEIAILGEKVKLCAALMIMNKSSKKSCYRLRVKTPSEIKVKADKGFEEIPQTNWVCFEKTLVEVLPDSFEEVKLYIKIPAVFNNFDRKWIFYIEIREEISHSGYPQGKAGIFYLACYPKMCVITKEWSNQVRNK